ncbi:hypothetical protein DFP94_11234 [Fontibacillus phaseoli]|uniref:Uncharacterized protein n=1 Tax=Fontibacillus phaseoli TaxID=1416533 RepID=A0A369B9Q3_9BACL|nr:hypothetical protein [Fontibacillus phaseoli]RCX16414.1 hypothetical protein DFP94_11234 [Fontibacillus phaseoli]
MLVNSLLPNQLLNYINQRQSEKIVDTIAMNKKINLSNEQVEMFKDVLSTELKTMYSKQLLSSYLNTTGTADSLSNPYLSFGLMGGSTNSLQQSGLFGGLGLNSPTSLFNLIPAYVSAEGMFNSITPRNMAVNAYARQLI